jgi:4-coumarate--CoA ligase
MPSQLLELRPAELEALLNRHPNILDSAIIGLPDDKLEGNDLPCAYVVRKNPLLTAEEVKQYVSENASDFKQLRGGVVFTDRIPRVQSCRRRLMFI